MTSVPIRDPLADHLITPQNAAFVVIDYQQNQFRSVRHRRQVRRSSPCWAWARDADGRATDQLGIARGRATARLGAGRGRSRNCRSRLHRPPVDGISHKSVLMERSRTDHTRDPLCPVCSRPIKNNATAIQLSGLPLQP